MTDGIRPDGLERRHMLKLGGTAAAGLLAAGSPLLSQPSLAAANGAARLPVAEIEAIIRAEGTVSNGVLNIEIDRTDLPNVHKKGVPIKPGFEINGNLCFQALPGGSTMFNGDLSFKPEELNPAIDQMIRHGLTFQAFHQHLFDLDPMVWFMHMRGRGDARHLARACAAVLSATSTPLPQAPPSHPTTPLNAKRLSRIIGAPATVGSDGVVGFEVALGERVRLAGTPINPFLNIFISVNFQPLGGDKAVVVPDFGMTAEQVNGLIRTMRDQGWETDCLYNQETAEQPQLFWSHQFKVGHAYQLAHEVRRGLDHIHAVAH